MYVFIDQKVGAVSFDSFNKPVKCTISLWNQADHHWLNPVKEHQISHWLNGVSLFFVTFVYLKHSCEHNLIVSVQNYSVTYLEQIKPE